MHRIYRNRKITAALLTGLLSLLITVPAFAEEGQAIGNFSGGSAAELTEGSADGEGTDRLILLSDGASYDPAADCFYYEVESSRFGISVPNGAITSEAVSITPASSLNCVLYKNGKETDEEALSCITAPGSYVLAAASGDTAGTVRVSFTIVSSPTGKIKEYRLPADFYVVSATLNGESIGYSRSYVDMSADGEYVIDYRSPEADKDFRFCVTVDRTPPTVTLSGVVNEKANEPVVIGDVEEGARLYLERNRETIDCTETITETGSYKLTVQDAAGNETVYDFAVVTYASDSIKLLTATAVVLILALIGGLIYYRKYMRVS